MGKIIQVINFNYGEIATIKSQYVGNSDVLVLIDEKHNPNFNIIEFNNIRNEFGLISSHNL